MTSTSLLIAGLRDVPFSKMTGSGNDFVFFDGRVVDSARLTSPEVIQAICHRHNGIGADGIVILEPIRAASGSSVKAVDGSAATSTQARIRYFNSDGSPADLCGNATLCSTAMSVELGLADASGMGLETPSGRIASRLINGVPEIDLQPVTHVVTDVDIDRVSGERRIGFAIAGIPHLVVLCDDADAVDLERRGPVLRWHASSGPAGANVNWVSPMSDGNWRYRTFERGVEGETLACGTGAVATAILLNAWHQAQPPVRIRTSSGRDLTVRFTADPANNAPIRPTLQGEGRVVFRGTLGDLGA